MSGHRISVEARLSAPVLAGPGAHLAEWVSLPGVKRPGPGFNHPLPSRAKFKERVQLHLCFPLGLHGMFWDEL